MTDKKLNVILDLDQTLLSAENYEYFVNGHRKSRKKYLKRYNETKNSFDKVVMDKDYIVFLRPGVQDFLDNLFENYNVSVWTAASKNYATFIIENIILTKDKPERKLDYVFFAYHCDISMDKTDNTKDLTILWEEFELDGYNKDNTIIIDDYEEVKDTQPDNCINVKPFQFIEEGSEGDKELKKVLKRVEKFKKYGIKTNGNKKKYILNSKKVSS